MKADLNRGVGYDGPTNHGTATTICMEKSRELNLGGLHGRKNIGFGIY